MQGDPSPRPSAATISRVPDSQGPGDESFRMLVDSVEDYAIFLLDPEGRVLSWNAGAQKLKGWTASEILGRSFETFYPESAIAAGWPREELRRACAEGHFEDEGWRLRKDGSLFWASVVITALRRPDGGLRGFAKVTRDLTQRRLQEEALRQSEEQLRLLVQSVKEYAIFLIDPAGHVRTWNTGAEAILGYTSAEAVGRHFSSFFTAQDARAGRPDQELQLALRQGKAEEQGWRVRKDGTLFWAGVSITPVLDSQGLLRGFAKVTRDLSEQRRLTELEQSSRRMSEFLAMLAHELRNPLAPIRNAVGMLKLHPALPASVRRTGEMVDRQVTHLTRLVDDLLDIGRIVTGKIVLKRERIDYREVVRASVEAVRPAIRERRHTLHVQLPQEPILVFGDATRLAQALQNLLHNAARYTPEAGQIWVEVQVENAAVVTSVRDSGCGISAEGLPRIFDLFVQENSDSARSAGGLGIGLTLARTMVEQHGGKLSAASEGEGLGSTFSMLLPLAPEPLVPRQERTPVAEEPVSALRVLVVDDNADSADTMVDLLNLLGHSAVASHTGEESLPTAAEIQPDLVLLDLNMPGEDGFSVLQRLRAGQQGNAFFAAAMTGYGQASDKDTTLAAGFQAHLTKPVALDELREVLAAAARQLRSRAPSR